MDIKERITEKFVQVDYSIEIRNTIYYRANLDLYMVGNIGYLHVRYFQAYLVKSLTTFFRD